MKKQKQQEKSDSFRLWNPLKEKTISGECEMYCKFRYGYGFVLKSKRERIGVPVSFQLQQYLKQSGDIVGKNIKIVYIGIVGRMKSFDFYVDGKKIRLPEYKRTSFEDLFNL